MDSLNKLLSVSIKDERGVLLNKIASIYIDEKEDYAKGRALCEQALALYESSGNKKGKAETYNLIALTFKAQNDFEKALEMVGKGILSLNMAKKNLWGKYDELILPKDDAQSCKLLGDLYRTGGRIYNERSNISKATENYLTSLRFYEAGLKLNQEHFIDNMSKHGQKVDGDKLTLDIALDYLKKHPEDIESVKLKDLGGDLFGGMRWTSLALGELFESIHDHKQALVYLKKAEQNAAEVGAKGSHLNLMVSIGEVYESLQEFDSCIVYYEKLLKKATLLQSVEFLVIAHERLGRCYSEKKEFKLALEHLRKIDELLAPINDGSYLNNKLYEKVDANNGRLLFKLNTAYNLISIGDVCSKTEELKQAAAENYNKAIAILEDALSELAKDKGKERISNCQWELGMAHLKLGHYDKAISYFKVALTYYETSDDKEMVLEIYKNLYEAFDNKKDLAGSYTYYKKYISLKDSLFSQQNANAVAELQKRFEVENKDNQIDLLNKDKEKQESEIEKQKLFRNSVIVGSSLVLLLGLIVLRGYIQKKKANAILSEQKDLIEKQKKLVEEKQKEVMDSIRYAQRIQKALITSERYIDKSIGRLNQ